jgi:hypothetical protein
VPLWTVKVPNAAVQARLEALGVTVTVSMPADAPPEAVELVLAAAALQGLELERIVAPWGATVEP